MTITSGFFNSVNGDRTYNADDMSMYYKGLISYGIFENIGNRYAVTATNSMTVQIDTGRAIVGTGLKWAENDASVSLQISASHPTLSRYTKIVLKCDNSNREVKLVAVDETPSSTPTYTAEYNGDLCLAVIKVGAGASVIRQSDITDLRGSNACPWVTGLIEQVDTNSLFRQWESAYNDNITAMRAWEQSMQDQFDVWFATLSQQLNVNTYVESYKWDGTVTSNQDDYEIEFTPSASYEVDTSDILSVHINGLLAEESIDYTWQSGAGGNSVIVTLLKSAGYNMEWVEIEILKSKIGFDTTP